MSEVMLQQTTVEAVRGRYVPFLREFPSLAALARARLDTVLAAWSGLGYYARARNMHRASREVLHRHGGRLPADPAALLRLPGFGPYTSAAVVTLAYGINAPAADVNVTRVVSRLFAIGGDRASRGHREKVLRAVGGLLPSRRPGDGLAAMMDLGQMVCTTRRPACERCPVSRACRARRGGDPESYPGRRPKPPSVVVHLAAAIARRGERAFFVRRRASWLDGLWEFPCGEGESRAAARRGLSRRLGELGLAALPAAQARASHTVAGRRLVISLYRAQPASDGGAPRRRGRWLTPSQAARAALPTLTRKIAVAAGFLPGH